MTLKEAITTAIEFEIKIRDHYAWAMKESKDPAGKKFFEVLTREEQGHVDYLKSRLKELEEKGEITTEPIPTVIPSADWLAKGLEDLKESAEKRDYAEETQRLFTALKLEDEATDHYKHLMGVLGPQGKELFKRFIEIEDGHTALVQTEIDVVTKTGFFYDFQEFNLDG
ncbi:MAG: hypothetical protein P8018_04355 [Acidobacteriota bacterium]